MVLSVYPIKNGHIKKGENAMNNKLYYYSNYLKVKQIKQNGEIVGYLTMTEKAYGIVIQLHYFNSPGYKINETFTDPYKAYKYFDSVLHDMRNY